MTLGADATIGEAPASVKTYRELPAVAEKVMIIGLDGATFDVLNPMMESGRMPCLKAFIERGTSGVLESTRPPITPAAWTTFMTGKTPGTHGIVDFERYDVHTNKLTFNSTRTLRNTRTLWEILGDKGLKVGAINVPMTYPPRRVNGFMISGFETPGLHTEFTYPASLKDELLKRWPDYSFRSKWRRTTVGRGRPLARNLRAICDSFWTGAEVTRFCGDRFGWDVLTIVYKLVDNLQHKAWKYLDPRFNGRYAKQAAMVADSFRALDDALADLLEYADTHDATVLIMSDHGHGSLEGKAQPNLLLKKWGYMKIKSGPAQSRTRAKHVLNHALQRKRNRFARENQIEKDVAVDFSRTRACVMHAGMSGFLYINLKGRQPTGIVEPADYEPLREELKERFEHLKAVDPWGRIVNLFTEVHKPEELYGRNREECPWMPDLLLVPADGLSVVRRIRGSKPVRWLSRRKIEGTHRLQGMLAAAGNGIPAGRTAHAKIVDAAPTILAMMGLRVPDDMEGRVVTGLFETPIPYETEPASETSGAIGVEEDVYSEEEQRILTERLADLGYLE